MRVLLLSFNWVEYLIEIGNALAQRGHEVHLGLETDRVAATVGDELESLLDPRVRYHLLNDRPAGLRDPRQLATIARLMGMLRSLRPDVVNVHASNITYLPFCLRTVCRAPVVLTVHDVTPHPGIDSVHGTRRRSNMVRRSLRKLASAVILHGKRLEQEYLAANDDRCRNTYVIPHGCYTVFKHWAQNGIEEIESSVLFFGRINEYKGIDYLLRAGEIVAKHIPSFKIIVAGDGSELHRLSPELEKNPRCILHKGYLPNERVASVFQQASIVALPYTEASQSGVVRIAYVFGKPVIVTAVGSLPESVRHGETGLVVPPRDEHALAEAIIALLTDERRRRAMGVAAEAMVTGDLSWSAIASKTEQVYQDVLNQRSAWTPQAEGAQTA